MALQSDMLNLSFLISHIIVCLNSSFACVVLFSAVVIVGITSIVLVMVCVVVGVGGYCLRR